MKFSKAIVALLACATAIGVYAAELSPTQVTTGVIKAKLKDKLGIDAQEMTASPVIGLYQVVTDRGVIYVSHDGAKLIYGNVYDLDDGMNNLTELALAGPRKQMMTDLQKDMLVYKAKNEKHVVTIFTDITCGYCRKLHSEMKQYNDLGITVRYLAFPRQGSSSDNANKMRSIWCAKNPNAAMDTAQNGGAIEPAQCNAKITEQYQAGVSIGVNGTPAIILENGTMVPGYQNADNLLKMLESKS